MALIESIEVATMIRETSSYAKILVGVIWAVAVLVAVGLFASPIIFTWIHNYDVKPVTSSLDRVTRTKLLYKLISETR